MEPVRTYGYKVHDKIFVEGSIIEKASVLYDVVFKYIASSPFKVKFSSIVVVSMRLAVNIAESEFKLSENSIRMFCTAEFPDKSSTVPFIEMDRKSSPKGFTVVSLT